MTVLVINEVPNLVQASLITVDKFEPNLFDINYNIESITILPT